MPTTLGAPAGPKPTPAGGAGSANPYGAAAGSGPAGPQGSAYGQRPRRPTGSRPRRGTSTPQGYTDPNAGYQQQYGQQPYGHRSRATPTRCPAGLPAAAVRPAGLPAAAVRGRRPGAVSESDEKTWGIISHISIPFFWFVGPLIAYLVYKDRSAWLKQVTTEALNFSILYSIAYLIAVITISFIIGLISWPLVFIVALIFCIMATMAASRHEFYKYPINVRFIK